MRICAGHWARVFVALRARRAIPAGPKGQNVYTAAPPAAVLAVNRGVFLNFLRLADPAALMGDACPLCQVAHWTEGADEQWIAAACEAEASAQPGSAPDVG